MPEAPEKFNTAMAAWQQWQEAPWGRLRYTVAEANLARHLDTLDGGALRVLDTLKRLELATTDRAPYMHTARAFQLTATKG
ncbi:hypothetical protein ACFYOD_16220 [Streptomyces sp. NPDC006703]|uniref:hypothetical protein n=1 Tax=Streptomyces sp. NPDC006703 TaxID=3364759 RepID=UPI0036C0B222